MRRVLLILATGIACRASPSNVSASARPVPPETSPQATSSSSMPTVDAASSSEEVPAETSVPGANALSPDEQQTLARCTSPRESARCLELANRETRMKVARVKDSNARRQMRIIARSIALSPTACGNGAFNPIRKVCSTEPPGSTPIDWTAEGWSCVAKSLRDRERPELANGVYSYAFSTDAMADAYEVKAVGCLTRYDGDRALPVETELVLRGKRNEDVTEDARIYRRSAPTR